MRPLLFGSVLIAVIGCGREPAQDGNTASPAPSSAAADKVDTAMLADLESKDLTLALKAAKRIAAEGDAATKRAAGPMLGTIVRGICDKAWREDKRSAFVEANRIAQVQATEAQLELQLEAYAAEEAGRFLSPLAAVGGEGAVALLLEKAEDPRGPIELAKAAVAALSAHPPMDKASQDRLSAAKVALLTREAPAAVATMDADTANKSATTAVGQLSVQGGPVENAGAVLAGMAAGFQRCYTKALQEDASTQGTLTLTLELDASGAVKSSTRESKHKVSKTLASCVTARAEIATFARPKRLPASVSFPVTFALQK